MKELVLDLITSYENRISAVEELITTTYQATVASGGNFGALDKERARLTASLQKTLAKNCCLRRKDFNRLMEGVVTDAEKKRGEIEEERKRVIDKIKGYLGEQKKLALSLKQQLVPLEPEKAAKDSPDALINNIKAAYQDMGLQLFTMLHDFQSHLEACHQEQEGVNHKLQRLVDRGESLSIEDLRELEATNAHHDRKAERDLRRREVARLLAHFKQHREGSCHNGSRKIKLRKEDGDGNRF